MGIDGPEPLSSDELVSVATKELWAYAKKVQSYQDRVHDLIGELNRGGISAKDWGVTGVAPFPQPIEDGQVDLDNIVTPDAPPELVKFRNDYENAHAALIQRLSKLEEAFHSTAHRFSIVAASYEANEDVTINEDGSVTWHATIPR